MFQAPWQRVKRCLLTCGLLESRQDVVRPIGHAVRRTSLLVSTLPTAAAETKIRFHVTLTDFDQTRCPIDFLPPQATRSTANARQACCQQCRCNAQYPNIAAPLASLTSIERRLNNVYFWRCLTCNIQRPGRRMSDILRDARQPLGDAEPGCSYTAMPTWPFANLFAGSNLTSSSHATMFIHH